MHGSTDLLLGGLGGRRPIITEGGRELIRHPSGKGTVMTFNDAGIERKVLVLDAQFRSAMEYINSRGSSGAYLPMSYFPKNSISGSLSTGVITDEEINAQFRPDILSSTQNTNIHLGISGTYGSLPEKHCQNYEVDGMKAVLPNINVLMRLWAERNTLDAMDLTAMANRKFAFGSMNNYGTWTFAGGSSLGGSYIQLWSSTGSSPGYMCCINKYGTMDYDGLYSRFQGVAPVIDLTEDVIYTGPTGRSLTRHASGMGTVMTYNDHGKTVRVLILDAAYRERNSTFGNTSYLPSADVWPDRQEQLGSLYSSGFGSKEAGTHKTETNTMLGQHVTEEWFNHNFESDPWTGRQNTDALASKGINYFGPAKHCRSILVDGVACDLPNIQTVQRMYADAVELDAMDPTAEANPGKKLTATYGFGMGGYGYWSSTRKGNAGYFINAQGSTRNYANGGGGAIAPVLEL